MCNINKKITTELHYKDIALIAVMAGMYQDALKKVGRNAANDEPFKRSVNLVNRLGQEMVRTSEGKKSSTIKKT